MNERSRRFARRWMMAVLLAGLGGAASASAEITPPEHNCQEKRSRSMAKYGKKVVKCGVRCQHDARRGHVPYSDCFPPYGGTMSKCLYAPTKGAQAKAVTAIRRACDPTVKRTADCPECYDGGDCTAFADDWVTHVQGQLDTLAPGIYCDPGTIPDLARCMDGVALGLLELANKVHGCHDRCFVKERRGVIPVGSCNPPTTDPTTVASLLKADAEMMSSMGYK